MSRVNLFKSEEEMIGSLDNFMYQSKGLPTSKLRGRLVGVLYAFIEENKLDTDPHTFCSMGGVK
jgi:hypothetical protein